jgi:hypothetical protein
MLWIQALLNVPRLEDRAGIAEYDHFGHLLLEWRKTAPSTYLHKQLDVTHLGASMASMVANLTMVTHKPTIDVEQAPFLLFQLSEPKLAYLKIDSFSIALRRSPSEDC